MTDTKIFVGLRPIRTSRPKEPASGGQVCQWDGCEKSGTHRAPVGAAADGLYLLFCADHSKTYSNGYNFYPNLSDPAVAQYQRDAAAGKIPTRGVRSNHQPAEMPLPSSTPSGSAKSLRARGKSGRPVGVKAAQQVKLKPLEAKAFETLGLPHNATPEAIRRRYKERLKLHHPDANSGNRQSEDRLQATLNAYRILKLNGFC